MQTILRVGLATLILIVTGAATVQSRAEEYDHRPKDAGNGRVAGHMERAGSALKEAGKTASAEARDVVQGVAKDARKSMLEARDRTRTALDEAREQVVVSAEGARVAMKQAGDEARLALSEVRDGAGTWLHAARAEARLALLAAAESLASTDGARQRDEMRAERGDRARASQWSSLRAQLPNGTPEKTRGHAPAISTELREELGLHAHRTSKLARIRALAVQANDTKSVERCDTLLAMELERHGAHVSGLLNGSRATGTPESKSEDAPPRGGEKNAMNTLACLSVAALLMGQGCVDAARTPPAPAAPTLQAAPAARPSAALTPATQGASPQGEIPGPTELPVPTDFETEVEATIRPDNYQARLAELERELARDSPK